MTALPREIFKAYDIRGVVGRTLTPDIVRAVGRHGVGALQESVSKYMTSKVVTTRMDDGVPGQVYVTTPDALARNEAAYVAANASGIGFMKVDFDFTIGPQSASKSEKTP